MAKQLNIGNTTSPVDVNITVSLKINGKTAIVSSSESLGESTRPLYLENGELLAGSQQYTFWENDTSNNVIVQNSGNYLLKTGDTMTGLLSTQNVNPSTDNTYSLGNSTYRYSNIFSTVGTIGTLNATTGTIGTLTVNGVTASKKFHSNASSPTEDLTVIPSDNAIALETGNGNGAVSAWIWREQYAPSNWGMYHNNSNNYVYFVGDSVARLSIGLADGKVMGACWNDYAEYRISEEIEPGRVVLEDEIGICQRVNKRLSPFAGVVSDTYGFAQGESEKATIPLAVAGRVLVYPYQNRKNYHVGDCVCTAPNGTVDIMTHEEEKEWPSRIVGTVSEIPKYETWGTGNIPVNGRIWIKVR